jgi:Spinocerebellar ataxia type 10 protein domain
MYNKVGNPGPLGAHHPDPTGFTNLKSDLVRLLGILVYEDSEVQDRIRLCEGIPVVMNLCVVDERNPCEHSFCCILLPRHSKKYFVNTHC